MGKMIKKMVQRSGKKSIKIDKICDVICGGNLARVDLSMLYSLVNTCQNQVKLCTLKVQDDVLLAIAKFCLSIKDCQSQAFLNDFTIKGLEPKILAQPKFLDCHE